VHLLVRSDAVSLKRKHHSMQEDIVPKREHDHVTSKDNRLPKVATSQGTPSSEKHAVGLPPELQRSDKYSNHRDFAHEFHNAVLETTKRQNKSGESAALWCVAVSRCVAESVVCLYLFIYTALFCKMKVCIDLDHKRL